MPYIHVQMFEGRTPEKKAELAKELTATVVRVLGGSADSVDILMSDIQRGDWATGGVLWSERAPSKPG